MSCFFDAGPAWREVRAFERGRRICVVAWSLWCALAPSVASGAGAVEGEESIRLGDDRFAVVVATPLTGWIAQHGPRFETTAAVVSVRTEGHEFLAGAGLADEFNPKWISPPGYDQANPGDPFLKVGVGVLRRRSTWRYFFRTPYPVVALASGTRLPVADEANEAQFHQQCDSGLGWAYDYTKTYAVNPATRTLTIRYRLRNTGEKGFVAEQYSHNWFRLGESPPDAAYRLESPFVLDEGTALASPVDEPLYRMAEQSVPAERNRATLRNTANGRWVEFSGDFAVSRLALFVDRTAYCPEVFVRWEMAPATEVAWSRTYRFGGDRK